MIDSAALYLCMRRHPFHRSDLGGFYHNNLYDACNKWLSENVSLKTRLNAYLDSLNAGKCIMITEKGTMKVISDIYRKKGKKTKGE